MRLELVGESKTDVFSYGLIYNIMGGSLTDMNDYMTYDSTVRNRIYPEKTPVMEFEYEPLDEKTEEEVDLVNEAVTLAECHVSGTDFEHMEDCLSEKETVSATDLEKVGDTLRQLNGTGLYADLRNNEEVRNRVSSLLSGISIQTENKEEKPESSLFDMSDFLETKTF